LLQDTFAGRKKLKIPQTQLCIRWIDRSKQIVSFCSEKFLLSFTAVVLTFAIASLLYLLLFERVDNLGAYSIPRETGLLIPSVNDNNHPNLR